MVDGQTREVKLPAAWANQPSGIKHWSSEARDDDPSVRVVHPPTASGIGDGKAFFFLFGFKRASRDDQSMLAQELAQINDDVETLCEAGYTVVVDPQSTRDDFIATVSGKGAGADGLVPAGFYWSAHGGADGSVECSDGDEIRPQDLAPESVSPELRLAIFGACYVGAYSRTWRRALGGRALVVGWGRPVTIERAVDFLEPDSTTTTDLDDLLRRWLLTDAALPVDAPQSALPAPSSAAGRIGALAERVPQIAAMLNAPWHECGSFLHVEVPLPGRHKHLVEVFLLDGVEPFSEGELLCGVEAGVGEISALVTPEMLVAGVANPGFGRVALVASETDMPRMITQSFVSYANATDQQLAAHFYQVAARADVLENAIFGRGEG